jgi:predicted molibdopterin-dependent oxidoreductase YjgC
VTALSGSETVEQAYALAKLLRVGLGAHSAVLPEATSSALDAFRAPLAAIAAAEVVVVIGEDEVADRAPIVDLWLKQAARNGAEVVRLPEAKLGRKLEERISGSDRAVLIWSGRAGGGGARLAELAHRLGLDVKPGCAAFHLPSTPNGRGVADAWAAAADGDEANPEPIGLLIVSGDEAAADPAVRALAEQAEHVVAITMFQGLAVGWADVVLPGTSYLERDGTTVNLEGRAQRLRQAVAPPAGYDELEFFTRLAERMAGNEAARSEASAVPGEPAKQAAARNEAARSEASAVPGEPAKQAVTPRVAPEGRFALVRYRPLFAGPAVERVPQLQFQRPAAEVELAHADGRDRGIVTGQTVVLRSNGTSRELTAKLNRRLRRGVVRVAAPHADGLDDVVELEQVST